MCAKRVFFSKKVSTSTFVIGKIFFTETYDPYFIVLLGVTYIAWLAWVFWKL
jgi:hypothetical protein